MIIMTVEVIEIYMIEEKIKSNVRIDEYYKEELKRYQY